MEILFICLLVFVASTAGTIAGFGTSTLMMPLMVMFYPAQVALFFVSIIHWFNGLWRVFLFKEGLKLKLILSFGLAGIVFSVFGAKLAFVLPNDLLRTVLGYFLLAYTAFLILNPQFKLKFNMFNSLQGGIYAGFIAGLFGVGGTIRGAFLAAFNFPKSVYLSNSAIVLLMTDSSRLSTYFLEGARLEQRLLVWLPLFIGLSYLGTKLGKKIVHKIPQKAFRYVICAFLAISAALLIYSK